MRWFAEQARTLLLLHFAINQSTNRIDSSYYQIIHIKCNKTNLSHSVVHLHNYPGPDKLETAFVPALLIFDQRHIFFEALNNLQLQVHRACGQQHKTLILPHRYLKAAINNEAGRKKSAYSLHNTVDLDNLIQQHEQSGPAAASSASHHADRRGRAAPGAP